MTSVPPWHEEIRQRLVDRNVRDTSYAAIFEQYRRLAQQARTLKERNQTLLRAVSSAKASGTSGGGEDNTVRVAYTASLEKELLEVKEDLGKMYKTQGQNAQRVIEMGDTLRTAEENARLQGDDLRRTKEELEKLRKELTGVRLNLGEKERFIQELTDDNNALSLELTHSAARNDSLKRDNAELLQRWLDLKNEEVSRMNEANAFYEDVRTLAQTRSPRSTHRASMNGDGESIAEGLPASSGMGGSVESGFREGGKGEGRKAGAGRERENG